MGSAIVFAAVLAFMSVSLVLRFAGVRIIHGIRRLHREIQIKTPPYYELGVTVRPIQVIILREEKNFAQERAMLTQAEKGRAFAELHKRAGTFIIPNPWDVGSARLLAQLGFEALATSSAGYAFSIGKPDNAVGREAMLDHAAAVAAATDLPVSIDLENGFGDDAETVAETIRLAAATGAVGGSIEDATGRTDDD